MSFSEVLLHIISYIYISCIISLSFFYFFFFFPKDTNQCKCIPGDYNFLSIYFDSKKKTVRNCKSVMFLDLICYSNTYPILLSQKIDCTYG